MQILLALQSRTVPPGLNECLTDMGLNLDQASGVAEARERLAHGAHDALLIDRCLPDGDGLDVVLGLRLGRKTLPVIVLDPGADGMTRILGLDAGADDYLIQPSDPEEIAARLRALLRRSVHRLGNGLGDGLACGPLMFDPDKGLVHLDGRLIDLSARETELLALLLQGRGMVVSRRAIIDQVFGRGEPAISNVVEVYVHRLRQKLKRAGGQVMVLTVKGMGYRLLPSSVPA